MKKILLAAALAAGIPAHAAVQYDERFVGFVGKGDVQSTFDMDNAALQAAAPSIRFRAQLAGVASWRCVGTNAAGKVIVTQHERAVDLASTVGYSARRNTQGQVTGFVLAGIAPTSATTYTGIGQCPPAKGWLVQPTLVPDSISYVTADPMLQVSRDGELWFDLPVTP